MRLGSFSTDDGDGRNSRFFKLFRVYSSSLEKSKVGEFFPGVDFLGTALKFRKRKKTLSPLVYVLHKT